jgi:hypothetical protein
MDSFKALCICSAFLIILGCYSSDGQKFSWGSKGINGCPRFPGRDSGEDCFPCNFFSPKTVTLVVRNVLRDPNFEESVQLNCTRYKYLWNMLQEAADINKAFRFASTYFGSDLGFFINTMNGLTGDYNLDQSYWEILDGDDQQTPVGVSSYKPQDGETVTFNFTRYGHTA